MRYRRELSALRKLADKYSQAIVVEPEEDKQERLRCEEDFHEFIKGSWHTVEGDKKFVTGWHITALCLHFTLTIAEGDLPPPITHLIVNMPPGYMKSLLAIMFNAWRWTTDPSLKFLHLSYSYQLSKQHNDTFRKIVTSPWYQKHWGSKFKIKKDNETLVLLSTPGRRISTSVGGKYVTGTHSHYIMLDDANSASDIGSKTATDKINEWNDSALVGRLLPNGVRIDIQQRLSDNDLTGHLLSKELHDIVLLRLPQEFEKEHRCRTIEIDGKVWEDPRTIEGELLWPEFKSPKIVAKMKSDMPKRVYAGQYQQRPMPLDGEIYQRGDFKIWSKEFMPDFKYIIQSWDTALKVGDNNCYSACTTWGVFEDENEISNVALVSSFRAKVTGAQLYNVSRNMAFDYYNDAIGAPFRDEYMRRPNLVLVEDKVNGVGLIEDLARSGVNVQAFNPKGDKKWRAIRASVMAENGKVWLFADRNGKLREFSREFLEMAISWPNNKDGTDLIDTMSQALIFFIEHSNVMPNTFISHKRFLESRPLSANL